MSAAGRVPRAVIFGLAGPALSAGERRLFADTDPLGFILFRRNCETPAQLQALIAELRATVGRVEAPVLIDQEGGRVQRLLPPHWRAAPPAASFGRLAAQDPTAAAEAVRLNARLIADELAAVGISHDCAPVLDVPQAGADPIIGDRAFAGSPAPVIALGEAFADGLLAGGVLPIVKHVPGHGRATLDSHLALPVVETAAAALQAIDFAPFAALAALPWAMTAHVVYQAFDAAAPATTSRLVIDTVIRGAIGFRGVLVSDDICMAALAGRPAERARAALAAGCDIVLHCNGKLAEMAEVAAACPPLAPTAVARLARAEAMRRAPEPFDRGRALALVQERLTMAAATVA